MALIIYISTDLLLCPAVSFLLILYKSVSPVLVPSRPTSPNLSLCRYVRVLSLSSSPCSPPLLEAHREPQVMSGTRMRCSWHPALYPSPGGAASLHLFILSLPPAPSSSSLLSAAAAAVRCQGNHSWLGGSPLHPIPPLLLSAKAGRRWDKARERRGAGGRWR